MDRRGGGRGGRATCKPHASLGLVGLAASTAHQRLHAAVHSAPRRMSSCGCVASPSGCYHPLVFILPPPLR